MGTAAGQRVAVAPGGPGPCRCSSLWPGCGAVCPVWSAGASGRAAVGPGSDSHVCATEGGGGESGHVGQVRHHCAAGGSRPSLGPIHLLCCSCESFTVCASLLAQCRS